MEAAGSPNRIATSLLQVKASDTATRLNSHKQVCNGANVAFGDCSIPGVLCKVVVASCCALVPHQFQPLLTCSASK